jgi:GDP-D-mannose dehydratase
MPHAAGKLWLKMFLQRVCMSETEESTKEDLTPCFFSANGKTVVAVDPRYFRPTEVETLLGDPSKGKDKLGWKPKITFRELVAEMVRADLEEAKKEELCVRAGFCVNTPQE